MPHTHKIIVQRCHRVGARVGITNLPRLRCQRGQGRECRPRLCELLSQAALLLLLLEHCR
jgi:hypothetical protein